MLRLKAAGGQSAIDSVQGITSGQVFRRQLCSSLDTLSLSVIIYVARKIVHLQQSVAPVVNIHLQVQPDVPTTSDQVLQYNESIEIKEENHNQTKNSPETKRINSDPNMFYKVQHPSVHEDNIPVSCLPPIFPPGDSKEDPCI